MSQWIAPNRALKSAGTWTEKETATADVWCIERTAADAACNVHIPIPLPSNGSAKKGSYLKSVNVWFVILVGALDAMAANIYKVTLQADGGALVAGESIAFTYDAGHDAAAERVDVDEHVMTLTLDTPVWIDDDEQIFVELVLDNGAASVFELLGARANYTFRV
jgi:hypothetical protein